MCYSLGVDIDVCAWCELCRAYPGVDTATEQVAIARSQLNVDVIELDFTFSRFRDQWLYIHTAVADETSQSTLPDVTAFAVCILCKVSWCFFVQQLIMLQVFNPEKYNVLCRQFATAYVKTADPVRLMEGYLQQSIPYYIYAIYVLSVVRQTLYPRLVNVARKQQ